MRSKATLLERAYELARSGTVSSVKELRKRLVAEGYARSQVQLHIAGKALVKELGQLCKPERIMKPLPPGRPKQSRAERLREKRAECLRLAESATDQEVQARFRQLAATYAELARAEDGSDLSRTAGQADEKDRG
jgi:hypothetical protein